jgi:gamma-glutamyltranspeptidase/glutathione hydrolase
MPVELKCKKHSVIGSRGAVATNHPLASAAGVQVLADGGNAVDAAVSALCTLAVVEPMNVGIIGGGILHIRSPDGRHTIIDGMSTAPAAARQDMFSPLDLAEPFSFKNVAGRANQVGAAAVAVPGNLKAWSRALAAFGRHTLVDLLEPAIRHARKGFAVSPYLSRAIEVTAADIARDAPLASLLLPKGVPLPAGSRLIQSELADSLEHIAREGVAAFSHGEMGRLIAAYLQERGGCLAPADLETYRVIEREPVRGQYRGFDIVGPPPPASGGMHIVQMLNLLESFDLAAMGFGSADACHLVAEALKIAFADRAVATADPAFVRVPVDRIVSKAYADARRKDVDARRATTWKAGVPPAESINTTHVTVADDEGYVVAATHTINGWFGACMLIPGLGFIPNNYMYNLDPRPGRPLSIAPGKRVTSSMSPMMVLRDGALRYALGMPGGLYIFGSVAQAIINLIDHRMPLQAAIEAPRLWSQGATLEMEGGFSDMLRADLEGRGHRVVVQPAIGGGMNAVARHEDGTLEAAACWRADGMPMSVGGGWADPDDVKDWS